jgi:uncharacterized membrane protein YjfL (UPF0719 family)
MMENALLTFGEVAATAAIACFTLFLAKLFAQLVAGMDLRKELFEADNPAAGAVATGYLLGCAAAFAGAFVGPSRDGFADNMLGAGYAAFGVLLVVLSRYVNRHFLFPEFNDSVQVSAERNVGAGAVRGASYFATGLVAGGAFAGNGTPLSAVVFFLIGQASLLVFARVYEKLSKYDLHDELIKGNAAAGVASGRNCNRRFGKCCR